MDCVVRSSPPLDTPHSARCFLRASRLALLRSPGTSFGLRRISEIRQNPSRIRTVRLSNTDGPSAAALSHLPCRTDAHIWKHHVAILLERCTGDSSLSSAVSRCPQSWHVESRSTDRSAYLRSPAELRVLLTSARVGAPVRHPRAVGVSDRDELPAPPNGSVPNCWSPCRCSDAHVWRWADVWTHRAGVGDPHGRAIGAIRDGTARHGQGRWPVFAWNTPGPHAVARSQ